MLDGFSLVMYGNKPMYGNMFFEYINGNLMQNKCTAISTDRIERIA